MREFTYPESNPVLSNVVHKCRFPFPNRRYRAQSSQADTDKPAGQRFHSLHSASQLCSNIAHSRTFHGPNMKSQYNRLHRNRHIKLDYRFVVCVPTCVETQDLPWSQNGPFQPRSQWHSPSMHRPWPVQPGTWHSPAGTSHSGPFQPSSQWQMPPP